MIIIFSSRDFVWAQNWRSRIFIKPEQRANTPVHGYTRS